MQPSDSFASSSSATLLLDGETAGAARPYLDEEAADDDLQVEAQRVLPHLRFCSHHAHAGWSDWPQLRSLRQRGSLPRVRAAAVLSAGAREEEPAGSEPVLAQRFQQVQRALHVDGHGDLGLAVRDAVDGLSSEVIEEVRPDVAYDLQHAIGIGDVALQFARQIALAEQGLAEPVVRHGNLDTSRDITDAADSAPAVVAVLEKGVSGEAYNIGTGIATSMLSLLQAAISLSTIRINASVDTALYRVYDEKALLADNAKLRAVTGWRPSFHPRTTVQHILTYWRQTIARLYQLQPASNATAAPAPAVAANAEAVAVTVIESSSTRLSIAGPVNGSGQLLVAKKYGPNTIRMIEGLLQQGHCLMPHMRTGLLADGCTQADIADVNAEAKAYQGRPQNMSFVYETYRPEVLPSTCSFTKR
jgi:hypothetical protein